MTSVPGMSHATTNTPDAKKYATVILAPHQDDETIRLSAYIAAMADRGDDTALICATDGSATGVRKSLGLSYDQITRWRNREQETAWSWLTDGRGGPITRLGFTDGKAQRAKIRTALEQQFQGMSGAPEIYAATWWWNKAGNHVGDKHTDHIACLQAAQDVAKAHGVVLRAARHPGAPGTGVKYKPTAHQMHRIEGAVGAYQVIGQRSVSQTFRDILKNPVTTVTA